METKNAVEHPSFNSPKPILLDQYPKKNFWDFSDIFQSQGFWYTNPHLEAARDILAHFESRDDDIFLTSSIKIGTTWLKALCFSIIHGRKNVDVKVDEEEEDKEDDPLVKNTPSSCVQTIENEVYMTNPTPDLSGMPSPRLFHTHFPYSALPDSIKNSECKIVYITRNPKDTMVSMWHFFNSVRTPEQGPYPFDRAFESFCDGLYPFGPFFDHVLVYWEASLKKSDKILFLRYEEIKRDPKGLVKRLASFLGRPFVNEEEVEKVLRRCSLDRLKNLEVNKNGSTTVGLPTNSFYRLGVVGDWKNHFSHEMEERLDQISSMKLEKTGLDLNK
ncbi:Cytosolic sulfotransferase 5 [Camellia lanceoleosa]|uniref:Cytosolic sulfotransferase 5 n=1 Tax=Camellia lanceoleosa TaxID=1840588 RepID=A0ACC0J5C4_9ERIC|nr:Cytosolic sulfotransferase 5 [Camellia lanceoleosa]